MPFPSTIDYDSLVFDAINRTWTAINGWVLGGAIDEVALLNRLIEQLLKKRRRDVGNRENHEVKAQVALLHRKGKNQNDEYGCDLALTVVIDSSKFVKTALFQLKTSDDYRVSIERRQCDQALKEIPTRNRSFIYVVDRKRKGQRFRLIKEISSEFGNQETKSFDCSEWRTLAKWLWDWLSCDIGEESKPMDPYSIETILQSYRLEPINEKDDWRIDVWERFQGLDAPELEMVPAKYWAVVFLPFTPNKNEY